VNANPFAGPWRIVWMSSWDRGHVDMDVPGHITFGAGRSDSFQFGIDTLVLAMPISWKGTLQQ
jgi:hypothetical protein